MTWNLFAKIKETKNSNYQDMEFKDRNLNFHIVEASPENLNIDTIKFGDNKLTKNNNTIDSDALELSVDIFNEPVCIKYQDIDLVQSSAILKQRSMNSKDLVSCDFSKNIKPTFDEVNFLEEFLNTNESYSKPSFKQTGIDYVNASFKNKKIQKNITSIMKPSTIPVESPNLHLIAKNSVLKKSPKNSSIATSFQEDDDSTILFDCQVWNDGNDPQKCLEVGRKKIVPSIYIEEFQENLKVNREEDKLSLKKQKIPAKMDMEIVLDSNDNINVKKQEGISISNNKNFTQDFVTQNTKWTTTTSILANVNSAKMIDNVKSKQPEEKNHNKTFNIGIQLLETCIGMQNI